MKNVLKVLFPALLACCPPVFAQDDASQSYGNTNVYEPVMVTNAYRRPPREYPANEAMPGQPPMPEPHGQPMPRRLRSLPREVSPTTEIQVPTVERVRQSPARPPTDVSAIPPTAISETPAALPATPVTTAPTRFVTSQLLSTVEVCTNAEDIADGCLTASLNTARFRLLRLYGRVYAGSAEGRLKVVFLASLSAAQQSEFLFSTETNVIQIVKVRLATADGKFAPRAGDTAQDLKNKQAALNTLATAAQAWAEKAMAEARAGSNWSHDWTAGVHIFTFQGAAYEQFKDITLAIRETN